MEPPPAAGRDRRRRREVEVDARGLLCPLPALRARAALAALAPGDALVILATDPEAPVDIGALAAEGDHGFAAARDAGGAWRLRIEVRGSGQLPG